MKLRPVGFFSEIKHGLFEGPSLKDCVSDQPSDNESKIVIYLGQGLVFAASPGLTFDVLSEDEKIIGSLALITDGTWLWPSDLSYYVEKYHATLPAEFVAHMESNEWSVPTEEIDLDRLELTDLTSGSFQ